MNDACSSLYGNESNGITARSINIEDVELRMTKEALDDLTANLTSNSATLYGKQVDNMYSTTYSKYPTIYAKENLSVINGEKNATGIGRSEQLELIGREDDGATNGKISTATSIQQYQTYWGREPSFMETAFKKIDGAENLNYELIFYEGFESNYFLASRCINTWGGDCGYYVFKIHRGIKYGYLAESSVGQNFGESPIFPVVSLNVKQIDGDDVDGYRVTVY